MGSLKQARRDGPYLLCYNKPTGKIDANGKPEFKRVQEASGLYDEKRANILLLAYEQVSEAVATKTFVEAKAREFLATVALVTKVSVAHTKTLEDQLKRWLESRKLMVAEKTYLNYKTVIDDFLAYAEAKNLVSLGDVTNELVQDFRDLEIKQGKSAATVNKALSILGQAFESAVINQVLPVNPARGLRVKGRLAKPQTRRAFSIEEFAELIKAVHPNSKSARGNTLHPDWQTFIVTLGYTGGRQQEVAKLDWERIDLQQRRITLMRSKSDDVHVIPIHDGLQRYLEALKKRTKAKGGPLMPYISQQTGRTLSKHFREFVLPRIGIRQPYRKREPVAPPAQGEEQVPQVGRRIAQCSLHSLRHSLSTWLHARGVQEYTRMQISGHENLDVSRGYTHESHAQMSAALATIPDVVSPVMDQVKTGKASKRG